MTELKKLEALAESIDLFLVKIEEISVVPKIEEVQKQESLLRDSLSLRVNKLLSKIDDTDPITQKPRYGKIHRDKVLLLHQKVSGMIVRFEKIHSVAQAEASSSSTINDDDFNESSIDESANIFSLNSTFTYNQRLEKVETTLMQAKEGEADTNLDLLTGEKKALRDIISKLHDKVDRITFQSMFEKIKVKYATDAPESFKALHGFLKSIITNICSRPEDENLRRIRICHPIVFSKIMKLDMGLEVLLTMGLRVTTAASESERPEEVQTFVSKYWGDSATADGEKSPCLYTLASLLYFSEALSQEIFLTMVEPSVENTKAWGEWWDNLTVVRSMICD